MDLANSKKNTYSFNVCKCCLTTNHILKDLWCLNLVQGHREVYGEMITKCFAISWRKPVDRTELICESCIKTLLIAFKFKRDVLASEQILLKRLKDEDNECNEIIDEDMIDDIIIHEDFIPDEDSEYKAILDNVEHLKEPVTEDHLKELRYFEAVYLEDSINVEPVKKEKDVTADSPALKHASPCALCGQNMPSSSSLAQHQCTRAASTSSRDVEEREERTSNKFICDICKGDFKCKSSLIQHVLHMHKYGNKSKMLLICKICNKQFSRRSNLIVHQRLHTGEKPYSCKICNKHFSRKSHLIAHHRVHTGEKPYSCNICNKQFSRSSHVITHQRIHTGEKPFSCKVCNKQFTVSSSLIMHQRVHTGNKPYSCRICSKKFSQTAHLITHQRIHTGNKPYSCKICSKKFSQNAHLITHQGRHTGKKPLV